MSDLTNQGLTQAVQGIQTTYSSAWISVGDSPTAFAPTQTDLQGDAVRKACSSVTRSGNSITFTTQFDYAEANFVWQEVGAHDAAAAGNMLVRKVISNTTEKPPTERWDVDLIIEFAHPT